MVGARGRYSSCSSMIIFLDYLKKIVIVSCFSDSKRGFKNQPYRDTSQGNWILL